MRRKLRTFLYLRPVAEIRSRAKYRRKAAREGESWLGFRETNQTFGEPVVS